MEYKKLTKPQVKAKIKKDGKWEGIMVGNKVNHFHFEGGWHLGQNIVVNDEKELDDMSNTMLFYLPRELGNRIAFYEK